jgi:hypothetical protein
MALFPSDRMPPELDCEVVQIRLNALELHRPRQWGACWLACQLLSVSGPIATPQERAFLVSHRTMEKLVSHSFRHSTL